MTGYPCLNDEQFQKMVQGLVIKRSAQGPNNILWLSFPVSMMREMLKSSGAYRYGVEVSVGLQIGKDFKEFLELEYGLVYPADNDHVYFMVTEHETLLVKYQFILGQRQLMQMSSAQSALLRSTITGMLRSYPPNTPEFFNKAMGSTSITKFAPASVQLDGAGRDNVLAELKLLSVIDGCIALPMEHVNHYQEIKRRLQAAGGSYHSPHGSFATGYFTFPPGIAAQDVLNVLQSDKVVNGKKDSQSFFTPPELAPRVVDALGPLNGGRYLEPSAGNGSLADLMREDAGDLVLIENHRPNVLALEAKNYRVLERDFLTVTPQEIGLFDGIAANPPFTKGMDIAHISHMWHFLKPNGVLSVIASQSWIQGGQRKQIAFREFLHCHGADIEEVPSGIFRKAGTTVATSHIVMRKPSAGQAFAA
ncbi:MAG: DNA methyltransferase family protein [Acidithiobacillus sp.]